MKTNTIFITLLLLTFFQAKSQQKNISKQSQVWYQCFITTKIKSKWSLVADGGFRTKDLNKKHTFLIRGGIKYIINSNVNISGGYAYFISYPSSNNTNHAVPEHRAWQRITLSTQYGRIKTDHRYRLEERFFRKTNRDQLLPGYRFNYRVGYQLNVQIPLKKQWVEKNLPFLILYDELFINFGKEIRYNYFDQNRSFCGIGYVINKVLIVTVGYQHIWRQHASGNMYDDINSVRLNLISNL